MAQIFNDILTSEQLDYINNLPEVATALQQITNGSPVAYFSVQLTADIKETLQNRLGLDLSAVTNIPMRWIKGDTAPHIDRGASYFLNTYLMYLTNSPGTFNIQENSYSISANTAFIFNEGLEHDTINTGSEPRLLLGPMNELAQPVGASVYYYPTLADAIAQGGNYYGFVYSYTVGDGGPYPSTPPPVGGYTSWRIAPGSSGSSPQNVAYSNGAQLNPAGTYNLYPAAPCFLEGSTILCQVDGVEKYVAVEHLKKGTLVKTSLDGYKPVVLVGKGSIHNPGNDERTENRLYKCSPSAYPELTEDLYITGCHSILEFPITEKQKEDTIKHLGRLFVTDKKYRLMACVDDRAEPWNSEGTYPIWHFALEHADENMNYGVYANGGLLVETCSIKFLKNKSNMDLI